MPPQPDRAPHRSPTPTSGRPRDAASLVITQGRGRGCQVLLGRREPRDRFLPDMYVFPGGRVDAADATQDVSSALRPEVAQRMSKHGSGRRSHALAVACIRETEEETGLLLGDRVHDQWRPALGHLDYVARAITPAGNPIRYHARFFHANDAPLTGDLTSNGELLDLAWRDFDASLELPMLDVTQFVLQTVARRLGDPAGDLLDDRADDETPFIHYRGTARHIRYE